MNLSYATLPWIFTQFDRSILDIISLTIEQKKKLKTSQSNFATPHHLQKSLAKASILNPKRIHPNYEFNNLPCNQGNRTGRSREGYVHKFHKCMLLPFRVLSAAAHSRKKSWHHL